MADKKLNVKKDVFTSLRQLEYFAADLRRFADCYKRLSAAGFSFEAEVWRQTILGLCDTSLVVLNEIRDSYRRPIDHQISIFELDVVKECSDELDVSKR